MGEQIETLDDLLRPGLHTVCIGINPSPKSVEVGHYYQGPLGQQFLRRLRWVGLLPDTIEGWEDDAAFELGIGFTDIVKRPTPRASHLSEAELEYGRRRLENRLAEIGPKLTIFTFKKTATTLFGAFTGCGFSTRSLASSHVFVMPGPYTAKVEAESTLQALRSAVAEGAMPRAIGTHPN